MGQLKKISPDYTAEFKSREETHELTETNLNKMYELLYLMYAEGKHSLLIILQGIDASGKDGVVKHIFTGANPLGIRAYSFKQPSQEELRHDFLWRCHRLAPERGMTAIFNRSYYEEVTTVKVHPELLKTQKLNVPAKKLDKFFERRYDDINHFEKMLVHEGTVVLKFFLHISKKEQKERLDDRTKDSRKYWKYSAGDRVERKHWTEYQRAFDEMIKQTDTKLAPWHIVPADRKWYRDYLVSKTIVEELEKLDMRFPALNKKLDSN